VTGGLLALLVLTGPAWSQRAERDDRDRGPIDRYQRGQYDDGVPDRYDAGRYDMNRSDRSPYWEPNPYARWYNRSDRDRSDQDRYDWDRSDFQRSGELTIRGNVRRVRLVDVRGSDEQRLVALLETVSGRHLVIDLGNADRLRDRGIRLENGDGVTARGDLVRVGDYWVLMADRVRADGRQTDVVREESLSRDRLRREVRGMAPPDDFFLPAGQDRYNRREDDRERSERRDYTDRGDYNRRDYDRRESSDRRDYDRRDNDRRNESNRGENDRGWFDLDWD